jgi:DNA-binding transcriptional MerR regulator
MPMASKSPDAFRTISEAAAEVGAPQHVLRFWEGRFTFIQPLKRAGGRRFYRPQDIAVLKAVRRLLHDEGLTIRGVQRLHREQGLKRLVAYADPEVALAFQPSPDDAVEVDPGPDQPVPVPLDASRRRRLQDVLERIERARQGLEAALAR